MARQFGKKMREVYKSFDKTSLFTMKDAVSKLLEFSGMRNFTQAVEVDVLLKEKKKSNLPSSFIFDVTHGIPKNMKILAVVSSSDADKMRQHAEFSRISDFVTIGDISLIQKMISTRTVSYDTVITTQANLNVFRPLAKELVDLDQKLMPSKKNGTVLDDNANIVSSIINLTAGTKLSAKRKDGAVRLKIASANFSQEQIVQNLYDVLMTGVLDSDLINKITISLSMGPGVRVNVKTLKKM